MTADVLVAIAYLALGIVMLERAREVWAANRKEKRNR